MKDLLNMTDLLTFLKVIIHLGLAVTMVRSKSVSPSHDAVSSIQSRALYLTSLVPWVVTQTKRVALIEF